MEPRYIELLLNEVLGITNDILRRSNSKINRKESRYNETSLMQTHFATLQPLRYIEVAMSLQFDIPRNFKLRTKYPLCIPDTPRFTCGILDKIISSNVIIQYYYFIKYMHRVQRRCVCHQNIKTRPKPLKTWLILIALQFRYTFYIPQTKD